MRKYQNTSNVIADAKDYFRGNISEDNMKNILQIKLK